MPEKFKSPWCLKDFLKENSVDDALSLSWSFRLELMERVAKILSDLHRKNRSYGKGGLNASKVFIQASDRFGLQSLAEYPPIFSLEELDKVSNFSESEGELAKLDQLCLGVVLLEIITQKPLDGLQLPQLVSLLQRRELGEIEILVGDGKLKKLSEVKEKDLIGKVSLQQQAKKELVKRDMIKEKLKRKDFDPEPQSRIEEAELFRTEFKETNETKTEEVNKLDEGVQPLGKSVKTKSSRNGSVLLNLKSSKKLKKTQVMMNQFFKKAQVGISKFGKSVNKRRKDASFPKWENFQKIHIPRVESPMDEDGRISRNLVREKDIIERKVDEEIEKKGRKSKKKIEIDEYVLAPIIKDEVLGYLVECAEGNYTENLKKPSWLLNLRELLIQLLTSVEDSRPSAAATRNWLLEILESYKLNSAKHEQVKKVIGTPEFLNMTQSTQNVKLDMTQTMHKADYVTNINAFDLIYKGLAAEEILLNVPETKGDVMIYFSKDVVGEILDSEDEDNMSLDSHQPNEKELIELPKKEQPKRGLKSLLVIQKGSRIESLPLVETELELEPELPPIFGPQADKLLQRMEKQRGQVGEVMTPNQVTKLFDEQKKMPHHQVVSLLKKAKQILDNEPNILNIDAPVIVVGDIHGQYFDLRQVMKFCGKPKPTTNRASMRVSRSSVRANRRSKRGRASKRISKAAFLSRRTSRVINSVVSNNEKDKLVFNQEEFIQELTEAENKPTSRADKYKTAQINGGSAPEPGTKALTLGRTLEGAVPATPALPTRPSKTKKTEEKKDKGKKFLFLGDYVDRGHWSCETLFYLLSLKVQCPESVIMLRGNHECSRMAEDYGFRQECEHKYGREVYHRCIQVFYGFPVGCLVNLPNGKRFFACHGGFSDKITSLEEVAKVERRREPGVEGVLCDILWSDPVPDTVVSDYNLPVAFEDIDFIPNETRGCSKKFGYRALETFLKTNELVGFIRAHEAKEEGFQFHFQQQGTKNHLCITVFSAPNYCNEHGNKGAVLLIHKSVKDRLAHQMKRLKFKYTMDQVLRQQDKDKDDYLDLLEPICYNEVVQPEVVAFDDQNMTIVQQIEETCPYMPTVIDEFYNSSLDILDRYGTAQQQLENYAKEQEEKKKAAELELAETKKEKAKIQFQNLNGRRVWQSMKFGTGSMQKLKELRKSKRVTNTKSNFQLRASSKFPKKRASEQHPQVMQEKIRMASARLEEMEAKAFKSITDDNLKLSAESGRLGFDNLETVKRGRALSAGVLGDSKKQEIMRSARMSKKRGNFNLESDVSAAEEDKNAVVAKIQSRAFMKRERVEIDKKDEWLQLLASWFTAVAGGEEIFPENLFDELENCVLLCSAAAIVCNRPDLRYYKPKLNSTLSPFEVRRNLIVFQDCCKDLGIHYMFLVYDLKNLEYNYVLPSLIELAKRAKKDKVFSLGYELDFDDYDTLLTQEIGNGLREIPDDAKEEDLKDKGLEVGAVTFNGEERLMLQLLFLMIDIDNTGLITGEAIIGWAKEEGKLIRPEHADQVISALDYDNDGAIGLRDFFQYAAKLKEEFLTEEFEGYEDYEDSMNGDAEDMMFESQDRPMISIEFTGASNDNYDPSTVMDLSKVKLDMEENSSESSDKE